MQKSFHSDVSVVRSSRKTLSIEVNKRGEVIVRAPFFVSQKRIVEFYEQHKEWAEKAKQKVVGRVDVRDGLSREQTEELRRIAKDYIPQRVKYYSELMGLSYSGVKITSAKTRFGSCSAKDSLCFSLYLMLYPKEAIDYVVVHELSHVIHKNHSKRFYETVNTYLPDYKEREKLLRTCPSNQ